MSGVINRPQPICPYCSAPLDKVPERKKKCPLCGQPIYVRTRPEDRQRVLATEQGAKDIDDRWDTMYKMRDLRRFVDDSEFERETRALTKRLGRRPSDCDVLWALHNRHLMESAVRGDWGDYRNVRLSQAELLAYEGRQRQALDTYLDVAYLDANGPNNAGAVAVGLPRFDTTFAIQAPGIVSEIRDLVESIGLDEGEVQSAFLAMAGRTHENLRCPVSPESAWVALSQALGGK